MLQDNFIAHLRCRSEWRPPADVPPAPVPEEIPGEEPEEMPPEPDPVPPPAPPETHTMHRALFTN